MTTPHLVQYQGSKRLIAPKIIQHFPEDIQTLYEPFAGTCAVSILAAQMGLCGTFVVNDINVPLMALMEECVNYPERLYEEYDKIWRGQYGPCEDNVGYFYRIRDQFNHGKQDPARTLFLLSRIVKGAVRYNLSGELNQACDNRRHGTKPATVLKRAKAISDLLKGRTVFYTQDYREIFGMATPNDLLYIDPPYQGTSGGGTGRDNRYISGVDFNEFVESLEYLNAKGVRYLVSYDGRTGDKAIGRDLPEKLGLTRLLIDAGRSTQATLNGRQETTYESLYLSPGLEVGGKLKDRNMTY